MSAMDISATTLGEFGFDNVKQNLKRENPENNPLSPKISVLANDSNNDHKGHKFYQINSDTNIIAAIRPRGQKHLTEFIFRKPNSCSIRTELHDFFLPHVACTLSHLLAAGTLNAIIRKNA
jgi:hypothetical protein